MEKLIVLIITVVITLMIVLGSDTPILYKSHSTGECVSMEIKGEEVPCGSSDKYEVVWVE